MTTSNEDRAASILSSLADVAFAGGEFLDELGYKLSSSEAVAKVTDFLDGLTSVFAEDEEPETAPEPEPTPTSTYTDPFAHFMNAEEFTDRLNRLLNRDLGLG